MRHQSTYWHRHWYVSIHLLSIHTSSSRPQGAVAYPRIHWTSTTYSTFCHQTHMGEHSHTYSQFKVSTSPDLHEWGRKHQILPMAELFWRSFSHKDKKRWHNYERRSYKVEHVIVEKWLERSLTQGKSEINSQLVFIVEFLVCWQWFILVLLHFYITSVASGDFWFKALWFYQWKHTGKNDLNKNTTFKKTPPTAANRGLNCQWNLWARWNAKMLLPIAGGVLCTGIFWASLKALTLSWPW